MHQYDLLKALLSEFLGSFILAFVGSGALALSVGNGGSVVGNAFAFGLTWLFLIYTLGNFSGAHYNPAISFGTAVLGRLSWGRMILYWIAQFLGFLAGIALISYIIGFNFDNGGMGGDLVFEDMWKVFLLEIFLSFFLIMSFLFITKNPAISMVSGIVLGLLLTALILTGGFFSKVGVNPALALGISVFSGNFASLWVFVVAPLIGALLAALIYKIFTIPLTCAEMENKDCGDLNCGKPIFIHEWSHCEIPSPIVEKPCEVLGAVDILDPVLPSSCGPTRSPRRNRYASKF